MTVKAILAASTALVTLAGTAQAADVAALPGDVVVVMRRDIHRTDVLIEPPFDRVEWLATGDDWQAGRLRPGPINP